MADLPWDAWDNPQDSEDTVVEDSKTKLATALPDSGDLHAHYDFSQEDGSTPVADQTGSGHDLSGSYSGVGETINGVQAGSFDGSGDLLSASWSSFAEPYTVAIVIELRQTRDQYFFDGGSQSEHNIYDWSATGSEWRIFQGASPGGGGTPDSNPHVLTAHFGSSTDILRIDGTEIINSDTGTSSSSGVSLGARADDAFHSDMKYGEVLFYAEDKSSIQQDIESYLADEWGVTI